jgi:hypothetical protein
MGACQSLPVVGRAAERTWQRVSGGAWLPASGWPQQRRYELVLRLAACALAPGRLVK